MLVVTLKYFNGKGVIESIKRIKANPVCGNIVEKSEIPKVIGGLGVAIISTSQGVL